MNNTFVKTGIVLAVILIAGGSVFAWKQSIHNKQTDELATGTTPVTPENSVVKIYFSSEKLNPNIEDCDKTFPVTRTLPYTVAVARAALEELLKGPSAAESSEGYVTAINPGVKIQSLSIKDGVARADFDKTLEFEVGGSCRIGLIRSQIKSTLLQFSTVKSVVISINGEEEQILQP